MIGKVGAQDRGTAAGARDLRAQAFGIGDRVAGVNRDRIPGLVQRERDRAADAARGAGHQGGRVRHFT